MSGPIDLFLVAGQSNAEGRGDSALSPAVTNGSLQANPALSALVDPVGGALTGSAWPAFANAWFARVGRPICVVPQGFGGSSLHVDAETGNGTWDTTGTLLRFPAAVTKVNSAIANLIAASWEPMFHGVLWVQGERDAQGGIWQGKYEPKLAQLIDRFQASFAMPHLKLFVFQTGRELAFDSIEFEVIREAQAAVAAADPDVFLVYERAVEFADMGWMVDSLHYSQAGLNEMGTEGAKAVADALGFETVASPQQRVRARVAGGSVIADPRREGVSRRAHLRLAGTNYRFGG